MNTAQKRRGFFITFEGGDGSGKSTQIKHLSTELRNRQVSYLTTREPGGTSLGEAIREWLVTGGLSRLDAVSETFLFAAARREHLRQIIWPALEEGKWVLCDRFVDSTIVYQGYGHGLGATSIDPINALTCGSFQPDLTFVFHLPAEVGLKRKEKTSGTEDRFERFDLTFHHSVEQGYQDLAVRYPERCVLLDGSQKKEDLTLKIVEVLLQRGFLSSPLI